MSGLRFRPIAPFSMGKLSSIPAGSTGSIRKAGSATGYTFRVIPIFSRYLTVADSRANIPVTFRRWSLIYLSYSGEALKGPTDAPQIARGLSWASTIERIVIPANGEDSTGSIKKGEHVPIDLKEGVAIEKILVDCLPGFRFPEGADRAFLREPP